MLYFEVTFADGLNSHIRILELHNTQINIIIHIKKLAGIYYKKYCKVHNLKISSCSPLDVTLAEIYSKDTPIDTYSYRDDFYSCKALGYAEKMGIIVYRVRGNRLIYNQNYYNREFICSKWRTHPCTYQRVVDLDTGYVESIRLKKLQKDGWSNV